MKQVTKQEVVACLQKLGIAWGDGLLVHSAIQYLGQPEGGLQMYLDAIQQVIGPFEKVDPIQAVESTATTTTPAVGTLAVPVFNFAFARGENFDPLQTPSQGMGVFSEYIRRHPLARRTPHPMQSLAVLGYYAQDLVERDTPSAFDPGSAFERMLELDFKILLLGADERAISLLHYSEQRAAVPYRYWKEFGGKVLRSGVLQDFSYRMFVRDLEIDAQLTLAPVRKTLEDQGAWRSTPLNYGRISVCRMADFVRVVDEALAENPWALVTNPPATTKNHP